MNTENNTNTEVNANRKYKDSTFTRLFGEKDKLAELYNAIAGTVYTAADIELTTLENIIFIGRENDISFTVGGKLVVLIEHQSTINPNMPLRCLFYIARLYQTLADNTAIYSKNLMKIMPPEFIVFYNGKDEYPEESTLNLSDAFIDKTDSLELKVKVYNINKGYNSKIMSKSATLNGYSVFVTRARENKESGLELMPALEKAVKDCIKDNILREFLEIYGSDVINMLSMEWNLEDAQKVWKNDGIIEGTQKKAEKVAEKMLRRGTAIEIVAEDTELSIEKVEEIANKINLGNSVRV